MNFCGKLALTLSNVKVNMSKKKQFQANEQCHVREIFTKIAIS